MKLRLIYIIAITTICFSNQTSLDIQDDIEETNKIISNLNLEIEKLNKSINSKEDIIKANELEIKKINNEIRLIELEIDKYDYEINTLEHDIKLKQEDIDRQEDERNIVNFDIESTLKEIELTKEKIEQERVVLNSIIEELDELLIYLFKNEKESILLKILNNVNNSEEEHIYKYISILLENDKNLIYDLEYQINNLNISKNKLEEAYILLDKQQIKLDKIIENLYKEKNIINKKIKKLNKIKNNYSEEFGSLTTNRNSKKERIVKLETEISNLRMTTQSKEMEIENFVNKLNQLMSDKNAAKNREEKLNKQGTKDSIIKQKGKLTWPVDGEIISTYGIQYNKQLGTKINNIEIFIGAGENEKVKNIHDGIVVKIGYMPGFENFIIIDHGEQTFSIYSNVKNIAVQENEFVKSRDEIAVVAKSDKTINGENTYLSFQIFYNEKSVDPEEWLKK